jgi:hypothetical protein
MIHSSRRPLAVLSAGIAAVGLAVALPVRSAAAAPRLDGFTTASSVTERVAEKAFLQIPSAALARNLDKQLAARTAMVGTANDKQRMRMIVARLRSFGLTPHVSTFYVYLSRPRHVSLTMTAPVRFHAANKERCRAVETDCRGEVVGYNALSPSGNITAPVVYVNYGTTADYATLAKRGVSVRDKIVLARYGGVFRGVKTNLAAEHGAKGVVLYSDPADDGNSNGKVYPHGPWRAPDGIQRGSVQQLWRYGGDPLTPGRPATKHAKRISPKNSNIAKIPTLPIGYASARPILKHLGGARAPKSWQGGLPLTYRLGSHATVHMDLKIGYRIRPVYDVTASIRGAQHPRQVVQLGAHHDAWTYGSDDNLSGAETVLQLGRAFKQLLRTGWRPARTIELGTWDGEEYGLFGSTEWAEAAGKSRLGRVVAYLNMDIAAGKSFDTTSLPSFDRLLRSVTKQVHWPGTNGTAYDNWAKSSGAKVPTPARLGSGSDYTAFIDHFGVPSADIGSSTPSGDYHCSCDNFYMEDHFIDPGWKFHVAIAQVVGLAAMRLADADVVPLHYGAYASEVGQYLRALAKQQHQQLGRVVVPLRRDLVWARAWAHAAGRIQHAIDTALGRGASPRTLNRFTVRLEKVERQLLVARGLPGRHWFKHQIYAPGVNSGYGTQELPAINDALFLHHNPAQAHNYESSLFHSLQRVTRTLR